MAIPLPELHQIMTDIAKLGDYVNKCRYYGRNRVASEIRSLRNTISMAIYSHTYYKGWLDERKRNHDRNR